MGGYLWGNTIPYNFLCRKNGVGWPVEIHVAGNVA